VVSGQSVRQSKWKNVSEAALSGLALLWLCSAAPARAFTEPRTYYASPRVGGGGGRWFTGSPAEGYACSVCHAPTGKVEVQLSGLPAGGYSPGASYDVTLSWPEFAARARELREAGDDPASMGLVAELVAESGEGAGTLRVKAADEADAQELCAFPEGALAAQMYRLQPGEEPVEAGTRCTSDALGERCVVAVLSCGAERLRFTWTAPATDQGTVWFAAGFVATEKVSGDPNGDAVVELRVPVLSADSAASVHASVLRSGCAVARPGRASHGAGVVLALALIGSGIGLRRRSGGRR
jgi:hypothetical protein